MSRKIVHFAGGMVFGGVEQVMLTTLERLDPKRWQPVLMHYGDAEIAPLIDGARAAGVRTLAVAHSRSSAPTRMAQIARALRAENPAVFHAHLPLPQYCRIPILSAALARVPVLVATAHLFRPFSNRRQAAYQGLLGGRIDRYIAVSGDVAAHLVGTLRIPARKITVIPNGVPLDRFTRPEVPCIAPTRNGLATVLASARLHPQKGLTNLVRAARLVPEATFSIAGDGPQRAELEALTRALGLGARVRFLGHRSDVPALLQSCDIFALPSLFEGLPLAVLEAMAARRPIVASDIGGVREAITNGHTGLLVRPGDPGDLAGAIRLLLSNPTLARALGERAGEQARREFSADAMVGRLTRLYDQLAAD